MSTRTITVAGMTCGGCASAVRTELSQVAGVRSVDVNVDTGTVTIDSDAPVDEAEIRAAVEEAGYELAG